MEKDTEQLLTPQQVAEWLQLPLQTLYNWRHRGVGPRAMRVGKHTRYRRRDVDTWLDAQSELVR